MFHSTEGILIKKTKLSSGGFILKFYTQEFGIKSYFGRKNKKQKTAFFPLSMYHISSYENNKKTIQNAKEITLKTPYSSIYNNIYKSNIILFINEILDKILKEEEQNQELYSFIKTALLQFDTEEFNVNFHLVFLMQLTQFLGIEPFPDGTEKEKGFYDLEEGHLTEITPLHPNYLTKEEVNIFIKVYYFFFSITKEINLTNSDRKTVIHALIKYYKYHTDMRDLKSLEVLEVVFG